MDIEAIKNYLDSQKTKVVKLYDFENKKVKYSEKIKGWKIDKFKGDEEIVRAYILAKLANELGYRPENIELEKFYPNGRPKTTNPRIDILVKDDKGNPYLFMELKSPQDYEKDKDKNIDDQLFSLAGIEKSKYGTKIKYLVYYTIDIFEDSIKDKALIIDYEKYSSFADWEKERNFTNELPVRYGKAQKDPYIKGGDKDLNPDFTHPQLNSLQKNLHNVLWGGGGTDDNEVFASLTRLILAKIQDEYEKNDGERYDFQIFSSQDGESFESNEEIYARINNLYKKALKNILNITDENEIADSQVISRAKFSLAKLKYTISALEGYSFVEGRAKLDGKDLLGDFFEGIIKEGFKQSKGQFFTHINVARFLLWGLQSDKLAVNLINKEQRLPYIIDPSAGSGTFLIEYMKFITDVVKKRHSKKLDSARNIQEFVRYNFPDHSENQWAQKYIYGTEINPDLGTSVKVNMVLHGDGSANVFVGSDKGDGLSRFGKYVKFSGENILTKSAEDKNYSQPINSCFDIIITNPPFSVTLDKDTAQNLKNIFIFGGKKNSENLFIERWYQLLRENGRLGAVLPESVFDTTENKYIRLFIYKYFNVRAVVSLPQLTFEPYTSTKTSLLFAQKKTKAEIEKWNELWRKYSSEWEKLKTQCENLAEIYLNAKDRKNLPSIKGLTEAEEKEILVRMLKNYAEENDKKLSAKNLVEKYQEELKELCKYDNDTKEVFGFVNSWWVFGEVAKELNYKIFMAEVENVGYKRTKRGEKPMPNELYRMNKDGKILVDDLPAEALAKEGGKLETALDYMRKIDWD